MQYTGARILIEALIEQGVDTVFGYPGGAVLFIYDELYKHKDRIRHILVSHEQHAAHAADAYARTTGKTGVCIATSGPGATNLVTGIATAYMDSVPLVAITGNVTNELLGKDSFQEADIAGITMSVVKHNWIVKDVKELAETVREAFIVARGCRPGPVLIDIPKDVTAAEAGISSWLFNTSDNMGERAARLLAKSARKNWSGADIERAVKMLREAERPAIYAGGGVIISGASGELRELAECIGAPVSLSLMAQGALPVRYPLYTGMPGMHGTVASNYAIQNCDLLITVGARFSDRVTSRADSFAKDAKVLHFDIDPAEINKNIRTAASVTGDLKETLGAVLDKLRGEARRELRSPPPETPATPPSPPHISTPWLEQIEILKSRTPDSYETEKPGLHPRFIIENAAKMLGEDAIIATDVGQHQIWTAQFYPFCKPRTFVTSGGAGTMGFGLGAALGAKAANPGKPVALFTGDGSFRMNCAELGTLAAYKLPVLVIIFNNGTLGMVRQWQKLFYESRFSETTLNRPPDFVLLAEAYGLAGFRAKEKEEYLAALEGAKKVMSKGMTAVIDAVIDIDEMVYPMVPGGKPIDEQILRAPCK